MSLITITIPTTLDVSSNSFWLFLLVGLVAGFLATHFVQGRGGGLLVDLLAGVVGSLVGNWLANVVGIRVGAGVFPQLVTAFVGAAILLLIVRAVTGSLARHRA
jgi:uncharacterized membrane protein YeaQ/YmgE (transglycosylase-associated protein family)